MTTAAAYIFAVLAISVASFQVALAGGMPWGRLTWGGKFSGKLPDYMRAFAVISAALLLAFTLVVAVRAGVVLPEWQPISGQLVWGVVAYCMLGVFANTFTPSRWERIVWLPVVLVMLVCSLIVATS